MKPLGKQGGAYRSHNAGQNHRRGGHPLNSPLALSDTKGNGSGDAFRQQGCSEHILHLKQPAQGQHTAQAGQRTRQTARQNGQEVLLQRGPLVVNIQGQHRGHRPQHQLNEIRSLVVALHRDLEYRQKHKNQHPGNHQRIAEHPPGLFLAPDTNAPGSG